MAHMLRVVGGKADMAYMGDTPWHGLGQKLKEDASLDEWATAAGLAFKVLRSKVRFATSRDPDAPLQIWEEEEVFFRNDTLVPLGRGSQKFKLVQPREALEFFDEQTRAMGIKLVTAGVLYGGSKYWAQASLPDNFTLGNGDVVTGHILFATACDGSMATTARVISTCVVCANTLAMGMAEKSKHAVSVKHSTTFNAQQVRMDLGLVAEQFDYFRANVEALARRRLTKAEAVNILIDAIGDRAALDAGGKIEDQPNARLMGEIVRLYNGAGIASNLASRSGTAWGLVNAATEFFDHHAGRNQDARLSSAWFGKNSDRKLDVFNAALALVA
jgi:phage/plasmid-like protein (TIGR03299 family)